MRSTIPQETGVISGLGYKSEINKPLQPVLRKINFDFNINKMTASNEMSTAGTKIIDAAAQTYEATKACLGEAKAAVENTAAEAQVTGEVIYAESCNMTNEAVEFVKENSAAGLEMAKNGLAGSCNMANGAVEFVKATSAAGLEMTKNGLGSAQEATAETIVQVGEYLKA